MSTHCGRAMPVCLRVASAGRAESSILSAGGAESMMLSEPVLRVWYSQQWCWEDHTLSAACWEYDTILFGCVIFFGGNLPKLGNPYCGLTNNQRTMTNQLTTEEFKFGNNRTRRCWHLTNKMMEVWQNLAPFSSRPIGATVEELLIKVLNRLSSGDHQYHLLLFFT